MRRPTPTAELYRWWRIALTNPNLPRHDGIPEAGWYRTRLTKGGPWVPVCIWCERDIDADTGELTAPERLLCEVDGQRRDPSRYWLFLDPITVADFEALKERQTAIPAMAATMVRLDLTERAMRP